MVMEELLLSLRTSRIRDSSKDEVVSNESSEPKLFRVELKQHGGKRTRESGTSWLPRSIGQKEAKNGSHKQPLAELDYLLSICILTPLTTASLPIFLLLLGPPRVVASIRTRCDPHLARM
ncbi:hypothetical protein BU16DRAFT_290177 [Lophium mytilinum]|uniref:Uncharacterized protein n=1 Tax=Lophium mytilinum TaxID=390894 RepID=A0A6A6R0P0_9PEZI|nr:hypothetical protein BU16DRAFT_290177 [Lophium mytilinum]